MATASIEGIQLQKQYSTNEVRPHVSVRVMTIAHQVSTYDPKACTTKSSVVTQLNK